jgi:hypothetical protein
MPDPAKSMADIDDVLSSIRRLVAETPAGVPRGAERPAAPDVEDKLVLTPSLRVSEPEAPRPPMTPVPGSAAETAAAIGATLFLTPRGAPADAGQPPAAPPAAEMPAAEMPAAAPPAAGTPIAETAAQHGPDASRAETAAPAPSAAGDTVDPAPEALPVEETAGQADVAETRAAPAVPVDTRPEHVVVQDAAETVSDHAAPAQAEPETPVVAFSADDALDFVPITAASTETSPPEEAAAGAESQPGAAPSQAPREDAPTIGMAAETTVSAFGTTADARMPETVPDAADAEPEEAAQTDTAQTDTAETDTAPDRDEDGRDVGGDGWRPEMRLFDWARPQDAAPAAPLPPAADFESDTGDAGWPDASAAGALRELAAVRDAAPAAETEAASDNVARFTPVFSRRSGTLTRVNEASTVAPAADAEPAASEAQTPAADAADATPAPEAARTADGEASHEPPEARSGTDGQAAQTAADMAPTPAADAAPEAQVAEAAHEAPFAGAADDASAADAMSGTLTASSGDALASIDESEATEPGAEAAEEPEAAAPATAAEPTETMAGDAADALPNEATARILGLRPEPGPVEVDPSSAAAGSEIGDFSDGWTDEASDLRGQDTLEAPDVPAPRNDAEIAFAVADRAEPVDDASGDAPEEGTAGPLADMASDVDADMASDMASDMGADMRAETAGEPAPESEADWRDWREDADASDGTAEEGTARTDADIVDAIAAAAVADGLQGATQRLTGLVAAEASAARDAVEADPQAGRAETTAFDEGFLDEETLRRIVADVVREELQGALGERITRNVRKLVRREIRLVLAADELD